MECQNILVSTMPLVSNDLVTSTFTLKINLNDFIIHILESMYIICLPKKHAVVSHDMML